MPDSESEDEILARIEIALQKIATSGKSVPAERGINKAALAKGLDIMIGRLRTGLEPPGAAAPGAAAPGAAAKHHTE